MKGTLIERFWPKVNRLGPIVREELGHCWQWEGGCTGNGYGTILYQRKVRLCHRVALFLENNMWPQAPCVCHRCDNKRCVRPAHLFEGTTQDNVTDKMHKGRHDPSRGEKNGRAKLTQANVDVIREMLMKGNTQAFIAKQFGVSVGAVTLINIGENWAASIGTFVKPPQNRARGEKSGTSKLTASMVLQIKQRLVLGEEQWPLAREFGVRQPAISAIKVGRTWKHIVLKGNNG